MIDRGVKQTGDDEHTDLQHAGQFRLAAGAFQELAAKQTRNRYRFRGAAKAKIRPTAMAVLDWIWGDLSNGFHELSPKGSIRD